MEFVEIKKENCTMTNNYKNRVKKFGIDELCGDNSDDEIEYLDLPLPLPPIPSIRDRESNASNELNPTIVNFFYSRLGDFDITKFRSSENLKTLSIDKDINCMQEFKYLASSAEDDDYNVDVVEDIYVNKSDNKDDGRLVEAASTDELLAVIIPRSRSPSRSRSESPNDESSLDNNLNNSSSINFINQLTEGLFS